MIVNLEASTISVKEMEEIKKWFSVPSNNLLPLYSTKCVKTMGLFVMTAEMAEDETAMKSLLKPKVVILTGAPRK